MSDNEKIDNDVIIGISGKEYKIPRTPQFKPYKPEKKLKTLKDIESKFTPWNSSDKEVDVGINVEPDGFASVVLPKELRSVAREWIKYIDTFERGDRKYSDLKGIDRDIDSHYYHRELLIEWIKYFFNLDLEDEQI